MALAVGDVPSRCQPLVPPLASFVAPLAGTGPLWGSCALGFSRRRNSLVSDMSAGPDHSYLQAVRRLLKVGPRLGTCCGGCSKQMPTVGPTFSKLCCTSNRPVTGLEVKHPGRPTWSRHRGFRYVGVPGPWLIAGCQTVAKGGTKAWHLLWGMFQAGANRWSHL